MDKDILRGDATFNLAPYKYPWAATMVEKSIQNTWFPTEVNMTRDRSCFEMELNPTEKHMFMTVFASLTTADAAVAENLCLRFYDIVKAAEIRYYLERQIAEEGIHRNSYQHCLEVLGVDQEEVYSMYQEREHIRQWFDHIRLMTSKNDILELLAFYYGMVEGTWFPCAFAAIYSLQRRKLMVGTSTQIAFIHKDESQHQAFGMKLFNECAAELGSKPHPDDMHSLVSTAVERMDEWADYCIPSVLGYNADMHKQHTRYLADRRLRQMGYEKLYRAEEALPWLDAMASIQKEGNFFEVPAITSYQSSAGLKFEENASLDDIANWK